MAPQYTPPPFPIQTPVAATFRPTPPPVPVPIDPGPGTARAWQQAANIVKEVGQVGAKAFQSYQGIKNVEKKKQVAVDAFIETFGNSTEYPELSSTVNAPGFREKAMEMSLPEVEASIKHYGKAANYYKQMKGTYQEEGKRLKILKPQFAKNFDGNDWVTNMSARFLAEKEKIKGEKKEFKTASEKDLIGLVNQQISEISADTENYPDQEAVRRGISEISDINQVMGDKNLKAIIENAVKSRTKTDVPHTTFSYGTRGRGRGDKPPPPPIKYKDIFTANNKMVSDLPKIKIRIDSLKQRQAQAKKSGGLFGMLTPQEEGDLKTMQEEYKNLQKKQKFYDKVLKKVNETWDPITKLHKMTVMEAMQLIQKEEGERAIPPDFSMQDFLFGPQEPSPFQGVGPLQEFQTLPPGGAPAPITAPPQAPPQQQVAQGQMF